MRRPKLTPVYATHILCLAYGVGCGESDSSSPTIDLHGLSRDEAVEAVFDAACSYEDQCGRVRISCRSEDGELQCTGQIVDRTYEACRAETSREEFEDDFGECTFNDEIADAATACFNEYYATPCSTQADIDEAIAQIESDSAPSPMKPSPACERYQDAITKCDID